MRSCFLRKLQDVLDMFCKTTFVEKNGSIKRILKKCFVGNSVSLWPFWDGEFTWPELNGCWKWPMKLGDFLLGHDLNILYLHHTGSWDSLFWLFFVPSNSQFFNEICCQGRPKPKQKPRCVTGRSGRRSVRATINIPGGVLSKFTTYKL